MTIYQIRIGNTTIVRQYYVVSEIQLAMGELKELCKEPTLAINHVTTVGDFTEQVRILSGNGHKIVCTKQDWEKMYGIVKKA